MEQEKYYPVSLFGFCKIPTDRYVEFGLECNKRHIGYELSSSEYTADKKDWSHVIVERPAGIHDLVDKVGGYFVEIDFNDK